MSSQLVFIENNQVLTDSLKVAKYFKDGLHKNVIRDIRKLIGQMEDSSNLSRPMFFESSYVNSQNKRQPMYLMNRDGFTLLVMGYEGEKALKFKLKYIEAFNAMEAKLKEKSIQSAVDIINDPRAMIQILTALADEQDKNKELTKQVKEMEPKAKYYDNVLDSSSLIPITRIAKEYGLSGQGLNRLLCKWEIQYIQGGVYVLYQDYAQEGYAFYEDYPYIDENGDTQTRQLLKWTQKGREFLHNILISQGYHRRDNKIQKGMI